MSFRMILKSNQVVWLLTYLSNMLTSKMVQVVLQKLFMDETLMSLKISVTYTNPISNILSKLRKGYCRKTRDLVSQQVGNRFHLLSKPWMLFQFKDLFSIVAIRCKFRIISFLEKDSLLWDNIPNYLRVTF